MRYLADGLGVTAGGDVLLGIKPLYSYNNVWYVDSAHGTDGAGYGVGPEKSCATLGYALNTLIGGAGQGEIIVLAPTHDETLANGLNFSTGGTRACTIVGAGTTAGRPSATLRWNNAAGSMLTVDREGVELRNIYFREKVVDNASPTVLVSRGCRIQGCRFDCGPHDTGSVVSLASSNGSPTLIDTSFVSTATNCALRPLSAIITGSTGAYGLYMDGVTFDGGVYGWSGYAFDQTVMHLLVMRAFNTALLNGADVYVHASTRGFLHVSQATGGARVVHG